MVMLDRRNMLGAMGAAGLAAWMGGCTNSAPTAPAQPFFQRIGKPIGIQIYALGEEVGADLPGTFRMLAEMGYGEIELPNLYGRPAGELKTMADDAHMRITSLHVPAVPFQPSDAPTFQGDPDAIARIAADLGIDQLIIPFPILPAGFAFAEGEDFPTAISRAFSAAGEDHWHTAAARFNEIGASMKERGLQLGYHNHNIEFATVGGIRPWDILVADLDPELVKFQLDLGWLVTAGQDPVAALRQFAGRVLSVHVKDVAAGAAPEFYFNTSPAETGSGSIDWTAVLPAAEQAGVGHYFVEQEPPFTMPRPEAMRKSIDFLKTVVA